MASGSSKPIPSYANLNPSIVKITDVAKQEPKLQLPELSPFLLPSGSKINAKLPELWKANSLENMLMDSLAPYIFNRENLKPGHYARAIHNAKEIFEKLLKKEKKRKQEKSTEEEDIEEIYRNIVADLDEVISNENLLSLLRQIVHIA